MGFLDGKAVVITGAGRGLGEAYALHAAQAGAGVVVNDIDGELAESVAARIAEQGGRAVASAASVRDPDQASGVVERCLAEFGSVDGLVNNAALNYRHCPGTRTSRPPGNSSRSMSWACSTAASLPRG